MTLRGSTKFPHATSVTVVDPQILAQKASDPCVDGTTGAPRALKAYVVVKEPRITVVPHFLSPFECQHIVDLVEGCWMPSFVGAAPPPRGGGRGEGGDGAGGASLRNTLSATRTSWSCMIRYAQTAVVERIEHRIASLAGQPLERLERMNAVRYAPGEHFDEHHDGRFRPVTVLVYLNELPEDEEEGDTFFPVLGISFRPRRGTAIMWCNTLGELEDGRTLHSGRAPTKCVKYGMNCFFNTQRMRELSPAGVDLPLKIATTVLVGDLRTNGGKSARADGRSRYKQATGPGSPLNGGEPLVAYRLCADPSIVAVPKFLQDDEADYLLDSLGGADGASAPSSTRPLRVYDLAETLQIKAMEERLCKVGGLGCEHLAGFRVVHPALEPGMCNRGCGPKSGYACLSQRDEVFFPRIGLRVALGRGDLLMWPNVDWRSGSAVEDMRTLRVHLRGGGGGGGGGPAVGVDAYFHDNPVREQRKLRHFVHDGGAGADAGAGGVGPSRGGRRLEDLQGQRAYHEVAPGVCG